MRGRTSGCGVCSTRTLNTKPNENVRRSVQKHLAALAAAAINAGRPLGVLARGTQPVTATSLPRRRRLVRMNVYVWNYAAW